jgi:hypothetical protein
VHTPTNRNRNIIIASAVIVVALLLAAGVIGMQLASDGDDDVPEGRAAYDTISTPAVPTPTTIDEHRPPTDERLVAALAAPSLVDLAATEPGADGEATTTDVTVDEAVVRVPRRVVRDRVGGGDGHVDPYVEVCATILGLPACVRL